MHAHTYTHARTRAPAQVWTRQASDFHEDISLLPLCRRTTLRSLKLEVGGGSVDGGSRLARALLPLR